MMELLSKLLKQPEQNTDLFYFCEDILIQLDNAPANIASNLPLFFALHVSHFFGFRVEDNYDERNCILDLQEGTFIAELPLHNNYIDGENALITSELLKVMLPQELSNLKTNHLKRRILLNQYMTFYALHFSEFGTMKTLMVLQEVLN